MSNSDKSCGQTRLKVESRNCAATFSLQVPKSCTNLDPTILYISMYGTYSKFVRKDKMLALGVCLPRPSPSARRRFAESRSRLNYYYFDRENPPPRGGLLFTMFPDQEPGGRGNPLKNHPQNWTILGLVLEGWSSSSGFLIWKPANKESPQRGNVVSNKLFWNWNGVVRFVSQEVWFDKGFVVWHFRKYCLVQIVLLRSLSIGVRIIFTTNVLVDRIKNFKWNASPNH